MNWWFTLPLGLIAVIVTLWSWRQARQGHFYSDTPGLWLLGIFVWGDGIILGPFWVVSAVGLTWVPVIWVARYILVFYALRSAYEVIYWINHQVAHRDYVPPLFRRWPWLKANESAILYQLLNTCQVVLAVVLLLASWR